jgi:hypothetical protein
MTLFRLFNFASSGRVFSTYICTRVQGCQMVYLKTKNPNLGKIWRVLQWTVLAYFMTIWSILWPFGYVYFVAIHYILWSFGIFFPVLVCCTKKNLATLHMFPALSLRVVINRIDMITIWPYRQKQNNEFCADWRQNQGCQIFLWTIYQSVEKYTKWLQNNQFSIKYSQWL